jgi:nuclear transport factor 2 (NTF2) superfamily protein
LTKIKGGAEQDFYDKVVYKIGNIWQDDPTGWEVLQAIANRGNYWSGGKQAIEQLSIIAKIHPEVLSILQKLAQQGESSALDALAEYWRDEPQTLPIIQQQAKNGDYRAIPALAEYWRDEPQTLPIIQQLAQKGDSRAIAALARYWREETQTFLIIKQQAQKGNRFAIAVLARSWEEETQTFLIIKQLAQKGDSSAIAVLARSWEEETQTFLIIKQLAQKGNSSAIAVLDQYWEEDGTIIGDFSTLRTRITDTEILVKSLQDLGITVKREADVRGAKGQTFRADIVAVLEGNYDIGWSRNSEGTFDLIADLRGLAKWHDHTELINSINQKYAINKTLQEVRKRQKDLGS